MAAVSRPTSYDLGPWVAAFLVLVAGVAQIALGAGQAWLVCQRPSSRVLRTELVAWNAGLIGTILGTIVAVPALTTVGGMATIGAVGVFLWTVWGPTAAPGGARSPYLG